MQAVACRPMCASRCATLMNACERCALDQGTRATSCHTSRPPEGTELTKIGELYETNVEVNFCDQGERIPHAFLGDDDVVTAGDSNDYHMINYMTCSTALR